TGHDRGDELIDDQRDAHAIRANAGGHELRKSEPDADSRAESVEANEDVNEKLDCPAKSRRGDSSNDSALDSEVGAAGARDTGQRILEECLNLIRWNAVGALNPNRRGNRIRADDWRGCREPSAGIDDGQGGVVGRDAFSNTAGLLQEHYGRSRIKAEVETLIGRDERLHGAGAVPLGMLDTQEQKGDDN